MRKTNVIPKIPHHSSEVNGQKINGGSMPGNEKNCSIKINNPPAKQMKLNITVIFVGGVHAI